MNTTYSFWIGLPNDFVLPDRGSILQGAFENSCKYAPVSYIQDHEDLNVATYLDIKINKWEIDPKWRDIQKNEPIVRIEFLRGRQFTPLLERFVLDKRIKTLVAGVTCITTIELDGDDIHDVDIAMLTCLANWFCVQSGIWVVRNAAEVVSIEALRLIAGSAATKLQDL